MDDRTRPAMAVVLVPGMSSVGSIVYEPLIQELKSAGSTEVRAVDLPSIDPIVRKTNLDPNALEADIKAITKLLLELIEQKEMDVLVVGHSYGGTPALCACEGFWRSQRSDKKGGVVRTALISSSLSFDGRSVAGDRVEYGQKYGGIKDEGARIEVVGEVNSFPLRSEGLYVLTLTDTHRFS